VEERNIMRRPPRPPSQPLFTRTLAAWSLLQGFLAFLAVAAIYLLALERHMAEAEVRALTFFSLVLVIVSLILVNRSFSAAPWAALRRPNPAFGIVLLIVTAVLGLSLGWQALRDLFHFGPLHPDDLGVTLAAGIATFAVLEALKRLWRRQLAF
jgi:Ca2+-transporting ATPase